MELEDLQKIDRGRMYEYYDRWPDIAKQSYEKEFVIPEFSDVDDFRDDRFSDTSDSGDFGGDSVPRVISSSLLIDLLYPWVWPRHLGGHLPSYISITNE